MKRPIPLATIIAPAALRYFGGEPAVAEPAKGNEGGEPDADLMSFEAPDIGDVSDVLSGKKEGGILPPPAKPAAEPAPKPGEKPAAPAAKPAAGEPPVKQLRTELDAVKKERDELKANLEKGDPRLVAAEKAVKEKETEIAESRTKLAEYERRLAMADPEVTKELRELDSTYDKEAGKFYNSVPEIEARKVHDLMLELDKLPFGTAEYRAARAAWEAKVNEALGGTEDVEHRKLDRALSFIERTREFAMERPKIETKLHESALKLRAESVGREYTGKRDFVKQHLEKAKQIPEGAKETDPYHPKIMLEAFSQTMKPEEVENFNKGIPEFIELVLAGVAPRGEQDYAGMTPAQVKESQARESETYEKARGNAVDVMYNGLRALRILPMLVKDWQRMSAKLKEMGEGAPPDPTKGGGDGRTADDNDLANFQPPDLGNAQF